MDTKLYKGDHWRNEKGLPVFVKDIDFLLQQAMLRLTIRKGSFPYNKALGSRLWELWELGGEAADRAALSYASEALDSITEVQVTKAHCSFSEPTVLLVELTLEIQNKPIHLEVMI